LRKEKTHPAVPLFKHKRGNIRNAGRNVIPEGFSAPFVRGDVDR